MALRAQEEEPRTGNPTVVHSGKRNPQSTKVRRRVAAVVTDVLYVRRRLDKEAVMSPTRLSTRK